MRERRGGWLAGIGAIALLALTLACAGGGLAVRAGLGPALDLQVPLGSYQFLLIHNGPTARCYGLRDSCRRQVVRYEFYVHYITPTSDRLLVWVPTAAP